MLWLFGQIWLWLLLAFALGAALTALSLTRFRRRPGAPPESPAERTGVISERPLAAEPEPYQAKDEPDWETVSRTEGDLGYREGVLPDLADPAPEPAVPSQAEWSSEPAWPRDEDRPERGR
ncbi:hypothetical protein [Amycolatopsis nigrescens]|uniref:hypothetical protein n=1 Tax=Amycolatopsis nigrescens TaxID=381445 RepID=UPI000381E176|nr:hypothetical protein [Amycolatopsis nigrescens]